MKKPVISIKPTTKIPITKESDPVFIPKLVPFDCPHFTHIAHISDIHIHPLKGMMNIDNVLTHCSLSYATYLLNTNYSSL